jgi:hypothetical protein
VAVYGEEGREKGRETENASGNHSKVSMSSNAFILS